MPFTLICPREPKVFALSEGTRMITQLSRERMRSSVALKAVGPENPFALRLVTGFLLSFLRLAMAIDSTKFYC